MRIRTVYNRIDRVIYTFDRNDIEAALQLYAKVQYKPGRRIEVEFDDNTATLTEVWESPAENTEEDDDD